MSAVGVAAGWSPPRPRYPGHDQRRPLSDVVAATRALMDGLRRHPLGRVSASTYETARVVTLAPWLAGHHARVAFLVQGQRADGGWGGVDGYALVPTLSATEALLTTARRISDGASDGGVPYPSIVRAIGLALAALAAWLRGGPTRGVPDMPAIELIAPMLVERINVHLSSLRDRPLTGLDAWAGHRLDMPADMDADRVRAIQAQVRNGQPVPEKLLHALEVVGPDARAAAGVRPARTGTVGASPAATAAWLGGHAPPPGDAARRYLERIVEATGGPMPCGAPITYFERAWVLGGLARTGSLARAQFAHGRPIVPRGLVQSLARAVGELGTPGGIGLPPDADTTAGTLYALAHLGVTATVDSLWRYELPTHFCTWPGEDGASTSVNAHVLEALGAARPAGRRDARRARAITKISQWLCEQQRDDGSWTDRWHASPYYATWCCVLALHRYGVRTSAVVRRAVAWVIATQRDDGGWGEWHGTAEETAYAVQLLLVTRSTRPRGWARAVAAGYEYLRYHGFSEQDPAMWHDKDLYRPHAIAEAVVVAAIDLADQAGPAVIRRGPAKPISRRV